MERTKQLYAVDGELMTFAAAVLACEPASDGVWAVLPDRTALFPGGGGQNPDEGWLRYGDSELPVLGFRQRDGLIWHLTAAPIPAGTVIRGTVNEAVRRPRMQNHSGEHVLSGIVHRRWGYDNVGFHMGHDGVTIDFSGELTWAELMEAEAEANRIITECRPITVSYPSPEELSSIDYRSKLELTENVRLVTVEDCDVCACCAPHVANTGEIGLLKILDAMRYKGGVRLRVLCGTDALRAYEEKRERESALVARLKVPAAELPSAADRLLRETEELRFALRGAREALMRERASTVRPTDGCVLLVDPDTDTDSLRVFANLAAEKSLAAAAVTGRDGAWKYVIVSRRIDLRRAVKQINEALNGRGGGKPDMVAGTFACTREALESFFGAFRG